MMLAAFIKNFPDGTSPPVELLELFEYETNNNGPNYAGDFGLCENGRELALAYFGNQELAKHFAVIGNDSAASLYALWLYEGIRPENAPVVYLEAEGQRLVVLAS